MYTVWHHNNAGEIIDMLNQHAGKLAQSLADEKKAYADREQAKANLQAALDKAKADSAQADALAQKCGAPPATIRIPGYSETFWDISS